MKFYFCEGCGQRITEHDLAAGEGRDKKLKGVYCSNCAVGVMTMETLPLTDEEARKVLESTPARPGSRAPSKTPRRRTSAAGLPISDRAGTPRRQGVYHPNTAPAKPASKQYLIVLAVAGVLLLTSVGVVLLGGRGVDPVTQARRLPARAEKHNSRGAVKEAGDASGIRPRGEVKKKASAATVASQELSETPPPDGETGRSQERQATAVGDSVSSPDSAPTGETETLQPAPSSGSGSADDSRAKEVVPLPEKGVPEQTKAADPPTNLKGEEAAKTRWVACLRSFDQALARGDPASASKVAAEARSDPMLAGFGTEVTALGRMVPLFVKWNSARQQAIAALTDGRKTTFQLNSGSLTGVVRKVEDGALHVTVEGRINNQPIEYGKRVKWSDLTPACRARLLGEKTPTTPDEWVATAARKIFSGDLDGVEKALAEAGAHPMTPHYRQRLDTLRKAELEKAARLAWEKEMVPLLKIERFTKAKARKSMEALTSFRETHGGTAFAASVEPQAKDLEKSLRATLGPPREVTLELGDGVRMAFVLIPAGTFMMGLKGKGRRKDKPQQEVIFKKPFYLGKYEVTQAQFTQLTGQSPSKWKGADLPVVQSIYVSKSAAAFCAALSKRTGVKARLPTEAEWEYACRAGTESPFSFGDSEAAFGDYGWFKENSGDTPHPVGLKKPNPWGLYDMHGNAFEVCIDDAGKDCLRGGSCRDEVDISRSALRSYRIPVTRPVIGFRVALDP